MNSLKNLAQNQRTRRKVTIALILIFALWSAFTVRFRLFVLAPNAPSNVFITEARDYFFEKSDLTAKKLEFRLFVYKDLWLSLPNVSKVVTTDEIEGADIDFGETPRIKYVTVDNQEINTFYQSDPQQKKLFETTLNQVSAAEWQCTKERLIRAIVIWALLAAALVIWLK